MRLCRQGSMDHPPLGCVDEPSSCCTVRQARNVILLHYLIDFRAQFETGSGTPPTRAPLKPAFRPLRTGGPILRPAQPGLKLASSLHIHMLACSRWVCRSGTAPGRRTPRPGQHRRCGSARHVTSLITAPQSRCVRYNLSEAMHRAEPSHTRPLHHQQRHARVQCGRVVRASMTVSRPV